MYNPYYIMLFSIVVSLLSYDSGLVFLTVTPLAALPVVTYIYKVKKNPEMVASTFSQVALFSVGFTVLLSSLWGASNLVEHLKGQDKGVMYTAYDSVLGFGLVAIMSSLSIAMVVCSMLSKDSSHKWLMHIITKRPSIKIFTL